LMGRGRRNYTFSEAMTFDFGAKGRKASGVLMGGAGKRLFLDTVNVFVEAAMRFRSAHRLYRTRGQDQF